MGTVETSDDYESYFRLWISFAYCCKKPSTVKMSEAEAQDAFIIFDEAYEGNDVDAFYLGDILRALGCNVTNAAVEAAEAPPSWARRESPSPTSSPSCPPSRPTPPPPESRRTTLKA